MADLRTIQTRIENLIERDHYARARALLTEAFALAPSDHENRMLAARVAVGMEDWAEARRNAGMALAADPDSIEAGIVMFRVERGEADFPAAEQTILGLLRGNPDIGYLYALYGELMLRAMHFGKAGALAREAIRLDPGDRLARLVLLLAHVIEGEETGALAELEEMVRNDPEALHVAWSMVAVLQSQHRYGEALEVMRGILHASPGDETVVETLIELRVASHWSTIPLWPLNRYGWAGSGALWMLAVGSFLLSQAFAPEFTGRLVTFYLVYVVYSWVWPPLLKRWLRTRGF